jgi:hypothetical protein
MAPFRVWVLQRTALAPALSLVCDSTGCLRTDTWTTDLHKFEADQHRRETCGQESAEILARSRQDERDQLQAFQNVEPAGEGAMP